MVIEGLSKTLRKNESLQCILPRTYQIDLRTRRFFFGQGLAIFLLFLLVIPLQVFGYFRHSMSPLKIVAMDALAGVYALWCWAWSSRRVILYEDAIEVVGWPSMRKLVRQEIRGRRVGSLLVQAGGRLLLSHRAVRSERSRPRAATIPTCWRILFLLDERNS
jgi:hypothetical protein